MKQKQRKPSRKTLATYWVANAQLERSSQPIGLAQQPLNTQL